MVDTGAMSDPDDRAPPYAPVRTEDPVVLQSPIVLDAQATAALRFRKVNPKEAFTLEGPGGWFRCALESLETDTARALPYERMDRSPEASTRMILAVAVLQRQRMLTVAQKAAELGAAAVLPVFTARSVQAEGLAHEKVHAWPGQALKGARQCRRGSVPPVLRARPLAELVASETWTKAAWRFFLDDRSEGQVLPTRSGGDVVLFVGPEGGFAAHERALLVEHGARPLRFGGRVLRAETAVFAGLAVLQYALGDLRDDGP